MSRPASSSVEDPPPSLSVGNPPPAPVIGDPPGAASGNSSVPLSKDEVQQYLNQPSQSILGKKRSLRERLAHQFENGKSLRAGLEQSNAPALELTPVYDSSAAVDAPRSTSVPLSRQSEPVVRSSTTLPRCELASASSNEVVTPYEVTSAASNEAVTPGGDQNVSAAGPSIQHTQEEIIYVVKVVYAHLYKLNTFMSSEGAWKFWNGLNVHDQAEVFQYYQAHCADIHGGDPPQPLLPEAGAHATDQSRVENLDSQPPGDAHGGHHQPLQTSSEAVVHSDPPPFSSGPAPTTGPSVEPTMEVVDAIEPMMEEVGHAIEPTTEEIIHAVQMVHAHYDNTTILSHEDAWNLWTHWNIQQRNELLQTYQELCASSSGGIVPPAADIEMTGENVQRKEPHAMQGVQGVQSAQGSEQGQVHYPLHGESSVTTAVRMRSPSPSRKHLSPLRDQGTSRLWRQYEQYPPTDMQRSPPSLPRHVPPALAPVPIPAPIPVPIPAPIPALTSAPHHSPRPPTQQITESRPVLSWQQQQQRRSPPRPPTVIPARPPSERATAPSARDQGPSLLQYEQHPPMGMQMYFPGPPHHRPPHHLPPRAPPALASAPAHAPTPRPPPTQQIPEQRPVRSWQQQPQGPPRPPTAMLAHPRAEVSYRAPPPFQQNSQGQTQWPNSSHQSTTQAMPRTLSYSSREQALEGSANVWATQPPLPPGAAPSYQQPLLPPPHLFTDQGSWDPHFSSGPPGQYQRDGTIEQAQYGIHPRNVPPSHTGVQPQVFHPARLTREDEPMPHLPGHFSGDPTRIPLQSHMQTSAPTPMHHPLPSRAGPPPAYLADPAGSSQATCSDYQDVMGDKWGGSQTSSFFGTNDFSPRLDKGKGRATDITDDFQQEGRRDVRPTPNHLEDTEFPQEISLNRRPQRTDVPEFVNSDGTLLVINHLQGLTDAVHESVEAQKQFSKEFMRFREIFQKGMRVDGASASSGAGPRVEVSPGQTLQQRKDNSLRALTRQKRVDEKVQRLRGQSRHGGHEADDEGDGALTLDNPDNLLEERENFRRIKGRIRHSLTSFLGIYDWSTVGHQYPTLTEQELEDYKQRKESIVPTVSKNFRIDFHLPWKRHPFNKENRHVFIMKFLARVEGGAYFKHPTPKEMLTHECIGFLLDNHMRYCRERWRRSLHPISPERLAELAKGAAQRSRRTTLHQSREVLLARRGYTKHRHLFSLLEPCNMSGDETDGEDKTTDSNYHIIIARWQSQELRHFLWVLDGYYRSDWARPLHRRAMGGNRPRQRVLHPGYSEDGIAPIGLWRNCYDKDWVKAQPAYIIQELEIVNEDYDFSFPPDATQATAAADGSAANGNAAMQVTAATA